MAGLDSFLFIVSTDPATFKWPSTQNRIRKHASRSACKSRRAKFVLERHNPRQFPPGMQLHSSQAVEPTFLEKAKIPALVSPEDWSLEDPKTAKVDVENAVAVASAPEFHSICRLSENSLSLAYACPIVLEASTRRLFHRLLDGSPSNRFGEYRDAWLPVVLSDSAAFQQYLSTFALHLQKSNPSFSAELKILMLKLHTQSLQAVNHRMRGSEVARDEGLLAAVVSFIAHYQVQQRYDMWQVHMDGLKNIIALQGGLREAFSNKARLRILLFFINLQGHWLRDLPMMFPPPYDLLPRISDLPISPPMLSSFHNASQAARVWRFTFIKGPPIPDIIDDLVKVTAHLASESLRTEGACWSDIMTTGLLVNPLIFRLHEICVKQPHVHSRRIVLQEAFRIAALLFLRRTRWHAMFISTLVQSQVAMLRTWLKDASESDWKGFEALKSWALVMGACSSKKHSAGRLWFIKELLHMVRLMHLANLADLLTTVKSILWIEDLFGDMAQLVWKEIRMLS